MRDMSLCLQDESLQPFRNIESEGLQAPCRGS